MQVRIISIMLSFYLLRKGMQYNKIHQKEGVSRPTSRRFYGVKHERLPAATTKLKQKIFLERI